MPVFREVKYVGDSIKATYKHKLDLYVPNENEIKDERKDVVVLFIHGGGWKRGDRNWWWGMNANVGKTLQKEGITTAVMSYRLASISVISKICFGILWGLVAWLVLAGLVFLLHLALKAISASFSLPFPLSFLLVGLQLILTDYPLHFFVGNLIFGLIAMFGSHEFPSRAVMFEQQMQDVTSAYLWVVDNMKQYGIHNPKVVIAGHSAGGNLCVEFAMRPEKYLPEDRQSATRYLSGCIGVSGVYHLGRMNKNPILRYWYISGAFGTTDKQALIDLSPLSHAKKVAFPVLLLTAQNDFHLNRDANDLFDALNKAGAQVERKIVAGKHHQSIVRHMGTGDARDTITPLWLEFCDRVATTENRS